MFFISSIEKEKNLIFILPQQSDPSHQLTNSSDNRFPIVEFLRTYSPNRVTRTVVFRPKIHNIKYPNTIDRLYHCKNGLQPCKKYQNRFKLEIFLVFNIAKEPFYLFILNNFCSKLFNSMFELNNSAYSKNLSLNDD